ncbi:MAG TPA: DUF192 domain-containing protein [Terracidiphilus sp.]|nr:DUF192 domain-containing protein [Terracidiphilus sp.]
MAETKDVPESDSKLRDWLRGLLPSNEPAEPVRYRVVNKTRQTEIGDRIDAADSAATRKKGLLGRTGLERGEGLWIVPCEAVHTFGMKFDLDLIYLDRRKRVVKVRSEVGRYRFSACLTAHSVIELPAGTLRSTRTWKGDLLEFTAVSSQDSGRECSELQTC